jgi:flagellar biosynthetic protein FliO
MELSEQILAVVMVLAILGGALWILKRKGIVQTSLRRPARSGEPRLEVIDRLALTPQHSVHLIRMGGRTLLVGLSPAGCNLLDAAPSISAPKNWEAQ